jgi:predicted N-acyltransferase
MNYQIQLVRRVEDIGQPTWDYLSREQPFTSYHWYRFVEHSLATGIPQYLIVSRDHEPLARATFWVMSRDFLPVSSPILRALIAATLRRWPLLVCQAPLTSTAGPVRGA